jgi:hypothetical protein
LAYWINAYNAFTIKMVVDHYPIGSIKDLYNGNPWDVEWITMADSNTYSLNMIEHEILRKTFNDPRIHFAVNCASQSCAPLYDRAYNPERVRRQLEYVTHRFINDKDYNEISASSIRISKIFDWYREDFGNVRDFVHRYCMVRLEPEVKISYMPYAWELNDLALRDGPR